MRRGLAAVILPLVLVAAHDVAAAATGSFQITQTLVNPRFGNRVVTITGELTSDYTPKAGGGSGGGPFPSAPFNELQITSFAIAGARLDAPEDPAPDMTVRRTYRGRLTGGPLTVSGGTSALYGTCNTQYGSFKVMLAVTVTLDGVTKRYQSPDPCDRPAGTPRYEVKQGPGSFSLSVGAGPAPPPARTTTLVPTPWPLPPPTAAAKPAGTAGIVAGAVEDVINSLKGSCFSDEGIVRVGDLGKFRSATTTQIAIETGAVGRIVTGIKGSNGSHWGRPGEPTAGLYLPFDPATKRLTAVNKVTLWHEMTHHLEWLSGDNHGDPRFPMKGFQERNTVYMERVLEELANWKNQEALFRDGRRSPDSETDRKLWNALQRRLRELEAGEATSHEKGAEGQWWPPDPRLEQWTGFRAKLEDIRNLYRSGICGPALQRLASD